MAEDLEAEAAKARAHMAALWEEAKEEARKHALELVRATDRRFHVGFERLFGDDAYPPETVAKRRQQAANAVKATKEHEALVAIVEQALDTCDVDAAVSAECYAKIKELDAAAAATHGIKAGRDKILDVLRELAGKTKKQSSAGV